MSSDHAVLRSIRRSADAAVARDWPTHADCFAEAFSWEDRRAGLRNAGGKAENIEQIKVTLDLGIDRIDFDLVEARGDRFALCHGTFYAGENDVVMLVASEVDTDGRQLVAVIFDEADADAARQELEKLSAGPM